VYTVDCQRRYWLCSCCDFDVGEAECYHTMLLRRYFRLEQKRC
jgi:hypothetical protein